LAGLCRQPYDCCAKINRDAAHAHAPPTTHINDTPSPHGKRHAENIPWMSAASPQEPSQSSTMPKVFVTKQRQRVVVTILHTTAPNSNGDLSTTL
jgi:hypothetical protein